MDFGKALTELKNGRPITREAWKTPDSSPAFLTINRGNIPVIPTEEGPSSSRFLNGGLTHAIKDEFFDDGPSGTVVRLPDIIICTPGVCIGPWTSSTIDLLAEDWSTADVPATA